MVRKTCGNRGLMPFGLDWTTDIAEAERWWFVIRCRLQGNSDPCVLYAGQDVIEREVENVLSGFGSGSGHVFNPGHGIHSSQPWNPQNIYRCPVSNQPRTKNHEPKFDDLRRS